MRSLLSIFTVTLLLSALVVSGCSSESSVEPVTSANASSPSEKNPLLGKWQLAPESLKTTEEYKTASDLEKQEMEQMAMDLRIEFNFTETEIQTSMTAMGQTSVSIDTYEIKKIDGKDITIFSTDDTGETSEAVAKLIDDDRLEITDDEMGTIILKRL